jgi:isopentenyl diphosphate isomerase/L-lactate dehydrogenase-like FMN-dependent dehydrogenase
MNSRRAFLKFLGGSPLFAAMPAFSQLVPDYVIKDPKEAINVLEFEAPARNALPPGHWGYLTTGGDEDDTLRANREGFSRYQLRPRRLVDSSRIDTSVDLFGTLWETPIALSPVGTIFHPEGGYAVARAAQKQNTLQILSGIQEGVRSIDSIMKARGGPVWYQLYASQQWDMTLETVKRVERAGSPAVVWTVDVLPGRNLETVQRLRRLDSRQCSNCHTTEPRTQPGQAGRNALTFDAIRRLKDATTMKVIIKGIEDPEDADLCVRNGADAIIVSNHGGRSTETGRGTIDNLPAVVKAVNNRIPVMIDGGFRRGTDIFKALAIGARAVCIGRPYLWGVSAFGQPGVEAVLAILRRELNLVMAQCGTHSLAEIKPSAIRGPGLG